MKKAKKQRKTVAVIERFGGSVDYDWEYDAAGNLLNNAQPPGPKWWRNLLGTDLFTSVAGVNFFFSNNQVPNEGLANLAGLTRLSSCTSAATKSRMQGWHTLQGWLNSKSWISPPLELQMKDWHTLGG